MMAYHITLAVPLLRSVHGDSANTSAPSKVAECLEDEISIKPGEVEWMEKRSQTCSVSSNRCGVPRRPEHVPPEEAHEHHSSMSDQALKDQAHARRRKGLLLDLPWKPTGRAQRRKATWSLCLSRDISWSGTERTEATSPILFPQRVRPAQRWKQITNSREGKDGHEVLGRDRFEAM